jgi:C-terminal region of band_7
VSLLSSQYLAAFGNIAKAGNTMLLPSSASDPATMVAQALSIYNNVSAKAPFPGGGCAVHHRSDASVCARRKTVQSQAVLFQRDTLIYLSTLSVLLLILVQQ